MMPEPAAEDRYVKVGNINTRYRAAGDAGPSLLLIHGLGGSLENWLPNIGPLSEHHRVFALDLRGFGRSDKTPLISSIYDLVRFLGGFMDVLEIEKASLAGNSLGGGLALQLAVEFPERVEKLVLLDNAGMGRETIIDFRLVSIPLLGELLTRPNPKLSQDLWQKILYDPSAVSDDLVRLSYELNTLPGAHRAFLTTLRAGINFRGQRGKLTKALLARTGGINVPVLVIWGKQDRILPVAHAEICRKCLPGAEVHILENCGHMPQLEYPEKVNRLMLEFLSRRPEPAKSF